MLYRSHITKIKTEVKAHLGLHCCYKNNDEILCITLFFCVTVSDQTKNTFEERAKNLEINKFQV
jgi:hypothetical protein